MLIYCDSCILIYFYDHIGPLQIRATNRLLASASTGDSLAVSDLVRLECRVGPMRTGDRAKLAVFDAFFARADVRIVPTTSIVFDRATVIRAAHGFRLGDSLHRAAAAEAGCDRFLTNDQRLSSYTDVAVEVLP